MPTKPVFLNTTFLLRLHVWRLGHRFYPSESARTARLPPARLPLVPLVEVQKEKCGPRALLPVDGSLRPSVYGELTTAALRPSRAWLDLLGRGAAGGGGVVLYVVAGLEQYSPSFGDEGGVPHSGRWCRMRHGEFWRRWAWRWAGVGLRWRPRRPPAHRRRAKWRRCWAAWRLPPWCPDLVQPRDPLLATCSRIAMEERFPGVGAAGELPELAPRRHALYDAQGTRTGLGRAARPRTVWCTTGGGAGGEERRRWRQSTRAGARQAMERAKGVRIASASEARGGWGREAQGATPRAARLRRRLLGAIAEAAAAEEERRRSRQRTRSRRGRGGALAGLADQATPPSLARRRRRPWSSLRSPEVKPEVKSRLWRTPRRW